MVARNGLATVVAIFLYHTSQMDSCFPCSYKIAKTSYLSPLLILKSCCVTVSFFNIEELLRYRRKEPQK